VIIDIFDYLRYNGDRTLKTKRRRPAMMRIVITGGPCAGKTSVINALKQTLGQRAMFLPEVATLLLSGGFPQPGRDVEWSEVWADEFQKAVSNTQTSLENLAHHEARKADTEIIICDRGLLDGAAYAGGIERFCSLIGIDHRSTLERYEMVIHLESMATAKPALYSSESNSCRYESLEEAQALEIRTRQVWQHHQRHIFVPGTGTLTQTIDHVVNLLSTPSERRLAS